MAVGTLASRGTGFLRTLMLVFALGVTGVANAYNNANTLPNAVYDLMLGGILTSVVVPLLVTAAKRDSDGGEAYDQRMFTLATSALLGLTVLATLAAGLLVDLYAHAITGPEHHLMVIFAYFFIPQIFFYGVSSLAGGILNARGHFAAPMWTPVINNVVVIGVLLLFIATGGIGTDPSTISASQVQLLGFGTTLGIIAQTAALIPFLRRVGFRWHPRFDFRRDEVREIRRMAAPLFGYVLTTQVSFLVVQNVANAASVRPGAAYDSFSTYSYAWQLFQLPYAIIGVSVITALLPRMSAHAAERRYPLVRDDFSTGVRLSSVIVVPAALLLLVLGAPARRVPDRARQHDRGRGPLHRRSVRHLLPRPGAVHDVPAAAAGLLRAARQPHPDVRRRRGDGGQHRHQPARAQRGPDRPRGGRPGVSRSACPTWWARWCPGASSAAAWAAWPAARSRTAWGGCTWPPCRPCSSPGP